MTIIDIFFCKLTFKIQIAICFVWTTVIKKKKLLTNTIHRERNKRTPTLRVQKRGFWVNTGLFRPTIQQNKNIF